MTYEIDPAQVRAMAGRYDAVAAPLAGFDVATVNVSGETFGNVELAAWLSAAAQQFDQAGQALHDGTTTMADNLRFTAVAAETTDDHVQERFAPTSDLGALLDPNRPATPYDPYGA